MQRIIKFRGFRADIGWKYGYYFVDKNGGIFRDKEIHYIRPDTERYMSYGVEPESVGEFTGLLDKNGKEIYEGDIIQDPISRGQVGYSPPGFLVDTGDPMRYWLGGGKEYPPNFKLKETEIIGNKFQNPELLKED